MRNAIRLAVAVALLAAAATPAASRLVNPDVIKGTTLFVMGEASATTPSLLDPARPGHRWTAYPILDGDVADAAGQLHPGAPVDLLERPSLPVRLAPEFARRLYDVLVPGTTVLVTDLPAMRPLDAEQQPQPVLESDGDGPNS